MAKVKSSGVARSRARGGIGLVAGRVGRPIGYRKPDALRAKIMVRLSVEQARWLWKRRENTELSMSEVIRKLIDDEMKRT